MTTLFLLLAFVFVACIGYAVGQSQHSRKVMPLLDSLEFEVVVLKAQLRDRGKVLVPSEDLFTDKELLMVDAEQRDS